MSVWIQWEQWLRRWRPICTAPSTSGDRMPSPRSRRLLASRQLTLRLTPPSQRASTPFVCCLPQAPLLVPSSIWQSHRYLPITPSSPYPAPRFVCPARLDLIHKPHSVCSDPYPLCSEPLSNGMVPLIEVSRSSRACVLAERCGQDLLSVSCLQIDHTWGCQCPSPISP